MKLKTSLHLHTSDDITEGALIGYTTFELIDQAAFLGFQVLALTCHEMSVATAKHIAYAKAKGILLLSGVELNLFDNGRRFHTLAINGPKSVDTVKSLEELALVKQKYPDMLVIAPHANFGMKYSMGLRNLEGYIDLFDAVEESWFYTWGFNLNRASLKIARKYQRPIVATADLHGVNRACLATDYCILEAESLTPEAVVTAIRQNKITNYSRPKSWLYMAEAVLRILWVHKLMKKKYSEH